MYRAGRAQPHVAFAGGLADAVEHRHVDQLAKQERDQRAGDGPHALAEHGGERRLVVGYAVAVHRSDPPAGRRQRNGRKGEQEAVADQHHRQPRDEAHAALAEELVDGVGHDEHHRPQQGAGGETQRTGLAEQVPVQRIDPQRVFQGEDLHPDQLGQHRIAAEERGQHDEQQDRAVLQWALDRRRGHAARAPARVNGTLDGATAPPEMMKLIAWSTVQSVGVSSSTGTISR
ncbi:hypothetical protein G6F59_014500 [Rhizopus arrhizus]|nr:hypothetical protein G6F59_014500 [Rhizopus arrhizus]